MAVLAIWSPWNKWNISILGLLGLQNDDNYAGLQVYSTMGEIEVTIDNEIVGNVTPEGSPLDIVEIDPGDHLVTIKRNSEDETAEYYEFIQMINFVKGINTVIAYEIGPNSRSSGGYIIHATSSIEEDQTYLNIRTELEESTIYINGIEVSEAPLVNYALDLSQDYKIKIENKSCEPMEFDLLPETKEERDLINGYDLNVDVNLFELPLETRETNE